MTLIITARSTSFALVTADGRSKGKISSNTFQKIFPDSERGLVIAHHGQNLIDECNVKDIVNDFFNINMDEIESSSIEKVSTLFVQKYGDSIRSTLHRIPESKNCGFLFIGFGVGNNEPKIYEAYWEKNNNKDIRHEVSLLGDFIRSGDGKKYSDEYLKYPKNLQFLKDNILKWNLEQSKAYCDKLYSLAKESQAKAGEDIFGGHKHQLVIKKNGCEWLIPPTQSTPTEAD